MRMEDQEGKEPRTAQTGAEVQKELERQLREFGVSVSDAFQHGFEGRGQELGDRPYGVGRVGLCHAAGLSAGEYAAFVKEKLSAAGVRFADGGKPVRRVAVGGGSCGSMLSDALAAGCDTFVTADVKYDQFLEAKALGLTLMDAGHYATENVVCPKLVQYLALKFPGIPIQLSQVHREAYGCV